MRPWRKIVLGVLVVLISFDGIRITGHDALGSWAAVLFAIAGVGLPLLIGICLRWRTHRGTAAITIAAISLWPLCIMHLWPLISEFKQWDYSYTLSASERDVTGFLLYLAAVSAWSLLSAKSISRTAAEVQVAGENERSTGNRFGKIKRWHIVLLGIFIGLIIILCFPLQFALYRHESFHSKAWDLAIFAQLSYNIIHGNGLEVSVRGLTNILSDHFQPIMFVVALLYPLFGGKASSLIIIQALAIATGVIPVALIVFRRNPSRPGLAFIIALVYALYAPLTFLLLNDFHPIALAVPLFLWAFYFLEIKRMWPFYIFLILAGCCQEEAWIVVGMVGLYLAIFKRIRRAGIILFLCSWAFFFWLVLIFIPSFRTEGGYFYIHRYAYLGSSVGEIAKNIFLHPGLWLRKLFDLRSIAFVVMMLAPLGFLPLRRPKILFILIPVAFYTLISGYDIQKSIFHQYVAPLIPFLFLSLIYNFKEEGEKRKWFGNYQLAAGGLLCALCVFVMMLLFPIGGHPEIYSRPPDKEEAVVFPNGDNLLYEIDEDDKVCTISKYAPHLVNREHLTLFPNLEWHGVWPDKILVDGKELVSESDRRALADLYLGNNERPAYGLARFSNGVFLFEAAAHFFRIKDSIFSSRYIYNHYFDVESKTEHEALQPEAVLFSLRSGEWYPSIPSKLLYKRLKYNLTLGYTIKSDFGPEWFFSIRGEYKTGEPYFQVNQFPMYGMYKEDLISFPMQFSYLPVVITEGYLVEVIKHQPRHYRINIPYRLDDMSYLRPARLKILPMQLPEGWTNTLDEYVTIQEQTVGINWDDAYVVDLTEEGN